MTCNLRKCLPALLGLALAIAYPQAFAQTQLPTATTPLTGTEILPIVQNGVTRQITSGAITNAVTGATNTWPNAQTFNGGVYATLGGNAVNIANPRKLTNAITAGLDPTGKVAVSSAVQAIIGGGTGIFFPCGTYLWNSTVAVNASSIGIVGESSACVTFTRATDFGPMLAFANAGGPINSERLTGFSISDLSAINGGPGYASCATSPYHVTMDGVGYSVIEDVRFAMGCGGLSIKGSYNIWLSHTQYFFSPISGAGGQSGLGTALYVGYSANANLAAAQSANIWVQDADIECGSGLAATKCQYGYVIDGADGVFAKSVHVEYATTADFHFANNTGKYMVNMSCVDCFADITPGVGVLLDGSSPVSNFNFAGSVDAAALNTANPGISVSGSGGLNNSTLDVHVRGWGAQGILMNASNTANVVIRPHDFTLNNVSAGGSVADIDVEQGSNISIQGGALDGYGGNANRVTYGIQFGAGVSGANVVGVSSRRHATLAMNVLSGAANINVVGGDFTGNSVPGVQVLGAAGAVSLNGVLGVPWTTYPPTIACTNGTIATLGAVTGYYLVKGKSVSLQIVVPITAIGTCATAITATLPTGLTSATATVLFGRETGASGKAITGSIGGAGGTALQIQNYDNSFAGANGANLILNGEIQIQ